jgi:hypothetical protein
MTSSAPFVRHLLTHLCDPAGVLRGWALTLRAGGRMIVQETAALGELVIEA